MPVHLRKSIEEFFEKIKDSKFHLKQLTETQVEQVNYFLAKSSAQCGGNFSGVLPPEAINYILSNSLISWDNVFLDGEEIPYTKGNESYLPFKVRTDLCWSVYNRSLLTEDEKKTS